MSKVAWIIFGAVVVVLFGGLVIYSRSGTISIDVANVDTNSVIAASDQTGGIADHVFGKTDSKIVLVEYGDFQCPSCGGAHPAIKEITEQYKDKIAFIFRNFPLTTIHPNARAAAAAVEAAGLSGKYWEMHNAIFESQSAWETLAGSERTDYFVNTAVSLGMNKDEFTKNLAGKSVNQKISFDQALGKKLEVNGTPTFYFQGKKVDSTTAGQTVKGSTTEMKALIDSALKEAGIEVPASE